MSVFIRAYGEKKGDFGLPSESFLPMEIASKLEAYLDDTEEIRVSSNGPELEGESVVSVIGKDWIKYTDRCPIIFLLSSEDSLDTLKKVRNRQPDAVIVSSCALEQPGFESSSKLAAEHFDAGADLVLYIDLYARAAGAKSIFVFSDANGGMSLNEALAAELIAITAVNLFDQKLKEPK